MIEYQSENPCKAVGCSGLCCINVYLQVTPEEIKVNFPKAVKVETNDLEKQNVKGVYFENSLNSKDYADLRIIGRCPNLSSDNSCGVYDQDSRPKACGNLNIGSEHCTSTRSRRGLKRLKVRHDPSRQYIE